MTAVDGCLERHATYTAAFEAGDAPAPPALQLAIVTCMDARIRPGQLLGLREGDAHVMRNAGGIVTDDVVRSLLLSQRLLGTREIMLIQHTECGLRDLDDDGLRDEIAAEVGERPAFALGTFASVEASVKRSVEALRANRFLPHRDAIRGFVYDVRAGALREVP